MTNSFKRALLSGIAATALSAAMMSGANATDGMMSNGYGTAAKGMAGAGSAMALDTQAAINNPAGMARIGNRFDAGVSLFSPRRDTTIETAGGATFFGTAGKTKSAEEKFYVPTAGVNFDMGTYALGLTLTANGGMNTEYHANMYNGGTNGKTGVDLGQVMLGVTYSRNLTDKTSIGITPTLAGARFMARGLQPFANFSAHSNHLTDNGYDHSYGAGIRAGILHDVTDQITLGAAYQSKMYMTPFTKYKGLFADGGDMDMPAVLTLGAAYKATDDLNIALDFKEIYYGDIRSISNTNNYSIGAGGRTLGTKTGAGFGWDNMKVIKLGASYDVNPDLTVRAGGSWNSAAFSDVENIFNILAPAVPRYHASVGGTYKIGNHEVGAAVTRAFSETLSGDSNVNHPGNTLDLRMDQWDVNVGYSYNF